jgi:transposase
MTSNKVDTVHVITSVQRRRRWSVFEKKAIVEETYETGKSVSYVARKHGISASQVFLWRRKMEEGALVGIKYEEEVIPKTEYKQALDRIRRLERLLGQKTEEVEILKEAIKIGREKKLIWHKPLLGSGGLQ